MDRRHWKILMVESRVHVGCSAEDEDEDKEEEEGGGGGGGLHGQHFCPSSNGLIHLCLHEY